MPFFGGLLELTNGPDCKSGAFCHAGANPASTTQPVIRPEATMRRIACSIASDV